MTKDYEADSIADETKHEFERQMRVPQGKIKTSEAERGTISPYTRAEFVAREVQAGIDAQGRTATTTRGTQVKVVDQDTGAAIHQRAELNAQAAERAGITWRLDAPIESASDEDIVDRISTLERREVLYIQAIAELSARIGVLEQQVARPIVAEIRDPNGARTIYHAIEERAKHEIRMLILEEIGHLTEEVIQPACETIGEHDRRLSMQLERITELTNNVHSLQQAAKVMRERLYENVTDDADYGLLEQVRRLDADMALVRDAVCPPQGGTVQPALANPGAQFEEQPLTFKCAGRYCPGLPYPPSEHMHPESCAVKPSVREMQDAIRGFSGPEIWSAMGTSRQAEVPVRERVLGVLPDTLWNALEMHAQVSLLDYLWRNHWGQLGSAASKRGIRCSYRGT